MSRFTFTFCFFTNVFFPLFNLLYSVFLPFYVLTNLCFIMECAMYQMYKNKLLLILLLPNILAFTFSKLSIFNIYSGEMALGHW